MGLALGTNLKFYTSVLKGLKLNVRKFRGLNRTFVEVTGEKLVGRAFCPPFPLILNRVKYKILNMLTLKKMNKQICSNWIRVNTHDDSNLLFEHHTSDSKIATF